MCYSFPFKHNRSTECIFNKFANPFCWMLLACMKLSIVKTYGRSQTKASLICESPGRNSELEGIPFVHTGTLLRGVDGDGQ